MLAISPESMVLVAVRSLMHAGERGIIFGGHAELSMELLLKATNDKEVIAYAKERVLFVEKFSRENLFPRLKCTVHHRKCFVRQRIRWKILIHHGLTIPFSQINSDVGGAGRLTLLSEVVS